MGLSRWWYLTADIGTIRDDVDASWLWAMVDGL